MSKLAQQDLPLAQRLVQPQVIHCQQMVCQALKRAANATQKRAQQDLLPEYRLAQPQDIHYQLMACQVLKHAASAILKLVRPDIQRQQHLVRQVKSYPQTECRVLATVIRASTVLTAKAVVVRPVRLQTDLAAVAAIFVTARQQ